MDVEKRYNKGFTLMEMLLVVAIIAALATVTIPSFSTALAAQREKSCEANRSALAAAATLAFIGGKDSVRDNNDGTMWVAPALLAQYACPSGGTYTVSWDGETLHAAVRCSEHGGEGRKLAQTTQDATDALNAIDNVFKSQTISGVKNFDSVAVGLRGSTAYAIMLTEAGSIMTDNTGTLNAVSWRYDGNRGEIYWSTLDIATLSVGTKVPVLRYNYKTGNYTVYEAKISTNTTPWLDPETEKEVSYTYPILALGTGYKPSTSNTSKDNQTYEAALIHYQNAMKEYHLA